MIYLYTMNLRQLEIFRAVFQTGTTIAAARLLLISQPAVSNILRQFESQIGLKLFQRAGGRLRPTREARLLYEQSEKVFSAFSTTCNLVNDLRNGWAGTLQIVASPSIGHSIVARALAAFQAERPHVHVAFDTPSNERIVEMLAAERAEFGLTITPIAHPSIQSEVIRTGAILCAMPPDHPLTARKKIRPGDLKDAVFISYPTESAIGMIIDEVFREVGEYQAPGIEVRYVLIALELVASGMGVAFVDEFSAAFQTTDRIVTRPVVTDRTLPFVLSRPRHAQLSTLGTAFVKDYLERELGDIGRRGG